MFRNPRSKFFFIKWLLPFIIFPSFFALAIFYDVFWGNEAIKRQNMEALQSRGIATTGYVIERDIPNVSMCRCANHHRLIFEFQTPQGAYTHELHVPDNIYEQNQLGDYMNFVYLPENPHISELQSRLNSFSTERYWAAFFAILKLAGFWVCFGFGILIFVLYLLSWLKR